MKNKLAMHRTNPPDAVNNATIDVSTPRLKKTTGMARVRTSMFRSIIRFRYLAISFIMVLNPMRNLFSYYSNSHE
jgi:hypothetical protein